MSSPNEPGYSRATEGGGNGSGSAPGPEGGSVGGAGSRGPLPGGSSPERTADATEVPPWQRGAAKPKTGRRPRTAPDSPARPDAPRIPGNTGATEPLPRHRCPAEPVPLRRLSHGVTAGAGRGRVGRSTFTRAVRIPPHGPNRQRPEPPRRPEPPPAGAPRRPNPLRGRKGPKAGTGRAPGLPSQPEPPPPPRSAPARSPTSAERHRVRRRASRVRSVPGRNRQVVPRPRRGGGRPPAAIRARCAPACRSVGWTRGAC